MSLNLDRCALPFIVSSGLLTAAAAIQLLLDVFFPIPMQVLDQFRPSPEVTLLGALLFLLVVSGAFAFVAGIIQTIIRASRS